MDAIQNPSESRANPHYEALERRIGRIGQTLAECLGRVVDAVPGGPHRPQEFATRLGINKDLSSRVFSAARSRDALAVAHMMPGPAPLRQLLRAASRHGVGSDVIREAERAIQEFDSLIRSDAGDRAALDAIIGAWLPSARERFETQGKQAMFRGAACLKGAYADTSLVTFMVHPSSTSRTTIDSVVVGGLIGMRRLRPGARVQYTAALHELPEQTGLRALIQRSPDEPDNGPLLREFCAPPDVEINVHQRGDRMHYVLADHGVGPGSAVDLFLAELYPGNHPRYRAVDDAERRWFYASVEEPAKLLIFDVLVHRDVWRGAEPELAIFDTTISGVSDPNSPSSIERRLELLELIQPLGVGLSSIRAAEIPQYAEMLRALCGRLGWDSDAFRAYRCRMQYPFYGAQVCMLFRPPVAPDA